MSIESKQNEIVEEFSMLDGDMEMTINYIMELGEQMPALDETYKTEDFNTIIKDHKELLF